MALDETALFKAVRVRLTDARHWCQEASARDAFGTPCDPLDAQAVAWDVRGALIVAMGAYDSLAIINPLLSLLACRIPGGPPNERSVTGTNDKLTHDQVLRWLDALIGE